ILAFLHIYPIKLFHKPHSILIDLWFCFCSSRIEIKLISRQMFSKCFCNLTAAGVMHTNKGYLFLIHRSKPSLCSRSITSADFKTIPKATTFSLTTRAGILITPYSITFCMSVMYSTSTESPISFTACFVYSNCSWQDLQPANTLIQQISPSFKSGQQSFVMLSASLAAQPQLQAQAGVFFSSSFFFPKLNNAIIITS